MSRPSRTAAKVAKGVVMLGCDPDIAPLLPRDAAATTEQLLRATGVMRGFELDLYRKRWFRRFAYFMERRLLPGQALAGALRKRFMDDEVRAAIAAGATQVLNVGAGFDTLCLSLCREYPAVSFVELDAPATHAVKSRGVQAIEAARPNLSLVGADLATTPLADATGSIASWRAGAATVTIAEGVLMYLEETAVASFLEQLRGVVGAGSSLLFSYMLADAAGRVRVGRTPRLMRWMFRAIGEPLRWGVPENGLDAFLTANGYALEGPPDRYALRERYLEPAGMAARALSDVERFACVVSR
jgi:methyltransferase (TIGR00027 family)